MKKKTKDLLKQIEDYRRGAISTADLELYVQQYTKYILNEGLQIGWKVTKENML